MSLITVECFANRGHAYEVDFDDERAVEVRVMIARPSYQGPPIRRVIWKQGQARGIAASCAVRAARQVRKVQP